MLTTEHRDKESEGDDDIPAFKRRRACTRHRPRDERNELGVALSPAHEILNQAVVEECHRGRKKCRGRSLPQEVADQTQHCKIPRFSRPVRRRIGSGRQRGVVCERNASG